MLTIKKLASHVKSYRHIQPLIITILISGFAPCMQGSCIGWKGWGRNQKNKKWTRTIPYQRLGTYTYRAAMPLTKSADIEKLYFYRNDDSFI